MSESNTWAKPIALSAMHYRHLALGAVMVERDGWQRPARYASVKRELDQLREAVGLCDISPVGKLSVQGDDLDSALARAFGDARPPDVGAVQRRSVSSGCAQLPIVLARLAHDEAMVFTEPGRAAAVSETLEQAADLCAHVVDVTSGLGGVRITGPSAHLLLAGVTELDAAPDALPNMSCAQTKIAEVHAVLLRLDVGSVCSSYEVYFGREFGEYMWDALLEAGDEHGAVPVGMEAMEELASSVHRGGRRDRKDG